MPENIRGRSAAWSFSDPLEYDETIRAADVNTLRVSGRKFEADLTRADFGAVWMQRFRETAPRLMRIASHPSRSIILFRTPDGEGSIRHGGHEVGDETLMFFGVGAVDDQTTGGPMGFGAMSLSPEGLARLGSLLAERDVAAPRHTTALRPAPEALVQLRFLHGAAAGLARKSLEILGQPEVARAFEDAFIVAMVQCVTDSEAAPEPRGAWRRAALIRRVEEFLSQNAGRPVYVTELCKDLAISARSLERACHEILDMGPKRFLWLRRLHLARRAHVEANSSETTVSKVAMAHGFWEFGRFSVRYRGIFGESPSATLRRPKRDLSTPSNPLAL